MPIIGLGTYALSDDEVEASVAAFTAAGGRLIDTAYMYHNEAAVGRAVRAAVEAGVPREELFVITKLYPSQFDLALSDEDMKAIAGLHRDEKHDWY